MKRIGVISTADFVVSNSSFVTWFCAFWSPEMYEDLVLSYLHVNVFVQILKVQVCDWWKIQKIWIYMYFHCSNPNSFKHLVRKLVQDKENTNSSNQIASTGVL